MKKVTKKEFINALIAHPHYFAQIRAVNLSAAFLDWASNDISEKINGGASPRTVSEKRSTFIRFSTGSRFYTSHAMDVYKHETVSGLVIYAVAAAGFKDYALLYVFNK